MFERTNDLHYPSPAELDRWGRSVNQAAASHGSLLLGLRFGASSPPLSGAAPAGSPNNLRFQLTPQPRFIAPAPPPPESVLGRLNRGGSFLPKLASPFNPQSDVPAFPGDSGLAGASAGDAGDYQSADPLDGLSPAGGANAWPQEAWQSIASAPTASTEPAWPDAPFNLGQDAANSTTGRGRRAATAPSNAGISAAASAFAGAAGNGLHGAGALPPAPTVTVTHSNSVKLKQEAVRAIATEFSERNMQQFNDLKRSISYYEASLRATFR